MAIEHIVLMETTDDMTDAQAQELSDNLMALKDAIPGIENIRLGKNFTDRAPHISHAAVITLTDRDALAAYGPHPAHQALLKIMMPLMKNVTIADIEV